MKDASVGNARERPLVVIGNPENRRVKLFVGAAARLGLSPPLVVAYRDLISQPGGTESLADRVGPEACVRIDSPGENAEVETALIRLGATALAVDWAAAEAAVMAAAEHGRIAAPRLWFAGYRRLLAQIEQALAPRGVRWMNHPADIPLLFDKTACQQVLAARGIPTPPPLADAAGQMPVNYDSLRRHMAAAGWQRVFVKLRYGSSASGVIALECASRRVQATTSVELVRDGGQVKLFNSLRVRRYTRERDVAAIIDELARHGLHVERWLPKAGFQGRVCDLRVVVIGGRVRHCVLRTSRDPLTNLHLGNRRGDATAFLRILALDQQQQA